MGGPQGLHLISFNVVDIYLLHTIHVYDFRERALHMFRSESYWLITTVSFGTCLLLLSHHFKDGVGAVLLSGIHIAQLKEPCKWAGLQTPASRRTLPQTQFAGIAGVRLLH